MLTGEQLGAFLEELKKLNVNLERMHQDSEDWKPLAKALASNLKDVKDKFKGVVFTGKQIGILNQILLQIRKSSGNVAMVQTLFQGIMRMAGFAPKEK